MITRPAARRGLRCIATSLCVLSIAVAPQHAAAAPDDGQMDDSDAYDHYGAPSYGHAERAQQRRQAALRAQQEEARQAEAKRAADNRRTRTRVDVAPAPRPVPTPAVAPAAAARPHPTAAPAKKGGPVGKDKPGHDDDVEAVEAVAVSAADSDGPNTWWGDAWPVKDRVLDAMTARTVRRHTFNTQISHRNSGGWLRDPFNGLFGFDAGQLKVALAVRFGVFEHLDVGVLRMNHAGGGFTTYEFDGRWNALSQERFGLDLGLRVGIDWFQQPNVSDAVGAFAQILFGRLFFKRLYAGGAILYASNSSGQVKSNIDVSSSAAMQLYADMRISSGFSWPVELTYAVAGYKTSNPIFTTGPKWLTNRHTFAIVLSNTRFFDADGIVTNSNRFNIRDWVLGFHITREL